MNATCFKCKTQYSSNDDSDIAGDGLCESCKAERAIIAKELDAKFPTTENPNRVHPLDAIPMMDLNGKEVINAKQLMGW